MVKLEVLHEQLHIDEWILSSEFCTPYILIQSKKKAKFEENLLSDSEEINLTLLKHSLK